MDGRALGDRDQAERLFLLAMVVLLAWLSFQLFRPFLDWVIFGFLFAYLFRRPYRGVLEIVRKPSIAAFLMLLLILLIFFVPFAIIVAILVQDVTAIGQTLAQIDLDAAIGAMLAALERFFGTSFGGESVAGASDTISRAVRARAIAFVTGFAQNLFSVIAGLVIGFFVFGFTVFYGLIDGPRIVNGILWATPLHRPEQKRLLDEVRGVIDAVMLGHVLIGILQALLGIAGFLLLGVPNAVLWGFVMLITALVPFVGAAGVWLPVGLFLLTTEGAVHGVFSDDRTFAALGVLLVVGPIVSTIDNLVRPKLTAKLSAPVTEVHPFTVLIGALGGLLAFGFTGLVLGPLVLSLFIAVVRVYRMHWTETDDEHDAHTPPPHVPAAAAAGARGPSVRSGARKGRKK